eukprot:scaffold2679_cov251-Pinguiococcus_pyrenoidosus.AAC.14
MRSTLSEQVVSLAFPSASTTGGEVSDATLSAVDKELESAPLLTDALSKLLYRLDNCRGVEQHLEDSVRHLHLLCLPHPALRRLEQQDARLDGENSLLVNQVRILEQDLAHAEELRKHENAEFRQERSRFSEIKEDLEKRLNKLEGRDSAYAANLRRSEAQYLKLQKQLKSVVAQNDRKGNSKRELTVVRVLSESSSMSLAPAAVASKANRRQRPGAQAERARRTPSGSSKALAVLHQHLESSEMSRCQELLEENHVLRDEVATLRQKLEEALAHETAEQMSPYDIKAMPASWIAANVSRGRIAEALYRFERSSSSLRAHLEGVPEALKEVAASTLEEPVQIGSLTDVENLQAKLVQSMSHIAELEKLVKVLFVDEPKVRRVAARHRREWRWHNAAPNTDHSCWTHRAWARLTTSATSLRWRKSWKSTKPRVCLP